MVRQIRTHYDNLKVSRDAPSDVIAAAYKALARRFHPDVNPDNPDAVRCMRIVNDAYYVLSDPERRAQHDAEISRAEAGALPNGERAAKNLGHPAPVNASSNFRIAIFTIFALVMALGAIQYARESVGRGQARSAAPAPPPPAARLEEVPFNPFLAPAPDAWVRPAVAPNGKPWPKTAGYIQGYKRLNTKGLSTVTIDNSVNDADVMGKLYSARSNKAVRCIFIPAYSTFTLADVSPGEYDVRYWDLSSNTHHKSEPFTLTETRQYGSVFFDKFTLTLYTVVGGNTRMTNIPASEF